MLLKKLAADIAEKTKQQYAAVVTLLRVRLAFDIMRSALMMLRGSRRRRTGPDHLRVADVVMREAHEAPHVTSSLPEVW